MVYHEVKREEEDASLSLKRLWCLGSWSFETVPWFKKQFPQASCTMFLLSSASFLEKGAWTANRIQRAKLLLPARVGHRELAPHLIRMAWSLEQAAWDIDQLTSHKWGTGIQHPSTCAMASLVLMYKFRSFPCLQMEAGGGEEWGRLCPQEPGGSTSEVASVSPTLQKLDPSGNKWASWPREWLM